jgi:hypothetical protein
VVDAFKPKSSIGTAKDAKEINAKVHLDAITRLAILMTRLVLCFPSRPWRPSR